MLHGYGSRFFHTEFALTYRKARQSGFWGPVADFTQRTARTRPVAFSRHQFSQIQGRQPYLFVRKIFYVIHALVWHHKPSSEMDDGVDFVLANDLCHQVLIAGLADDERHALGNRPI